MDIQLITGIEDTSLRQRWSEFLRSSYTLSGSHKIVGAVFESLSEALDHASTTTESGGIIVVSDQHDEFLIEMKDKLCDKAPSALATVAFVVEMPADRRLTDIDGVLAWSAKPEAWATTLDRVVAKLAYMRRPSKVKAANDIKSVEPREIQTIDEFRDGLRLRHDVYSVMGYLEYGYLATGSRLEANWCDTRAKHYGLFVTPTEGSTELAATARVILTKNWPAHSPKWVEQIVRPRRSLAAHIQKQQSVLARWILPAFESMDFSDLMVVAFAEQQWGELSRVIVSPKVARAWHVQGTR